MPMPRTSSTTDIQIENDTVRVSRSTFPPGSETGRHRHEYDYVVVPVTDGTLTIEVEGDLSEATLVAGVPYNRSAGVDHNVINDTDKEIVFVEIELRDHPEP